jgi:two-component system sensor histidine kinase UhpB
MRPHPFLAAATALSLWRAALVCLTVVVSTALLGASPDPAPSSLIEHALAVPGAGASFPGHEPATTVTLPDNWASSRPRYEGSVWYRTSFGFGGAAVPAQLMALYIERACTNLQVHLNGYLIYSGGRMVEPVTRNCLRPHLISLPAALLRGAGNIVDIRLQGHALQRVGSVQAAGGLSRIELGQQSALAASHSGRLIWSGVWLKVSSVILIGLGCVILAIGWLNPREVYFSYFGWLCLAWVLMSLATWTPDMPWQNDVTEFMLSSFWAVLLAIAVQFFLSFAGLRSRAIEYVIALQWVALPYTFVLFGANRLFVVASVWYLLLALELAGVIGIYLVMAWRQRPQDFGPMALAVAGGGITLLIELAIQQGLAEPPPVSVAQVVLPLLLLGVGARLLRMFAAALEAAEADRLRLARQLQDLTAEFEARVEQLTAARVEQFTERERKRIASDLHDDLGAKLLTIVHTRDGSHVPQLAREALEEMRLSVRGLAGKPVRLADALGDWRAEIVARLGQANIEASWESPDDEATALLPARVFLQLTRILREAVSNVIKHSAASRCLVRCEVGAGALRMTVRDDGRGISADLHRGQGMSSMKRRAKKMNGQCLVESRPGYGVAVSLTVPL